MRKKIFVAVLSATLLMSELSATGRFRRVATKTGHVITKGALLPVQTVAGTPGFIFDAYRAVRPHLTLQNGAIAFALYYLAVPCLNRAHWLATKILNRGETSGHPGERLINLAKCLLTLPNNLRNKIDPYANRLDVIEECLGTPPEEQADPAESPVCLVEEQVGSAEGSGNLLPQTAKLHHKGGLHERLGQMEVNLNQLEANLKMCRQMTLGLQEGSNRDRIETLEKQQKQLLPLLEQK